MSYLNYQLISCVAISNAYMHAADEGIWKWWKLKLEMEN